MGGNSKSALVAVLDWGLGHATRSVPVIRELQRHKVRVVIGGSGLSLQFLQSEFPELSFYELPSYGIVYPRGGNMVLSVILQLPRIMRAIRQEKKQVDGIVIKEGINFIISDNRYGCYSKRVRSIFISHQLNLQVPRGFSIFAGLLNRLHIRLFKKFHQVWVPDQEKGFHFSGILSESKSIKSRRVGILSRFTHAIIQGKYDYDVVGLISGPEPQRTIFENKVRDQLLNLSMKTLLIKGTPGGNKQIINGRLTEIDHVSSMEMESILTSAKLVIARSGYSTIMDLATLGRKALLVPTPGQTEQEYLAQYLSVNKMAFTQSQSQLDIDETLKELDNFSAMPKIMPNELLAEAIQDMIA